MRRYAEHVATLVKRVCRSQQRTAFLARLNNERSRADTRDNAVSLVKIRRKRPRAREQLAYQRAAACNYLALQRRVLGRIVHEHSAGEHTDSPPTRIERGTVSRGISADGETAHDSNTHFRERSAYPHCGSFAVFRDVPRAYRRNAYLLVESFKTSADEQQYRRIFNIPQQLGIFVIVKSNYADIVFAALLEDRAYRSHTYLFGTLFLLIAQKREFSVAYHSRGKSCVAAALCEYLNGFRVVRLHYEQQPQPYLNGTFRHMYSSVLPYFPCENNKLRCQKKY